MQNVIQDHHGRQFYYLRLSVTDVCNFRCQYCLPSGYQGATKNFLSIAEIKRAVVAFSNLGLQKIRLTGGEPTLRKDLFDIAKMISLIPTVKKIAITTNGYTLPKIAAELYDSGVRGLNISIDSLDKKIFKTITGHDKLPAILEGITVAHQVGFQNIKINTVLLKGINDDLSVFLDWIKTENVSLRMIELMQNQTNESYFKQHYVSAENYIPKLVATGWQRLSRELDAGPAQIFMHPDYVGRIGFIAPYSKDFCLSCNRLRFSATGQLYLCLFGELGYNLRPLLQADSQLEQLQQKIAESLQLKQATHYLHQGNVGSNINFSHIGG